MLLFSNIKKYNLRINPYFTYNIVHHTNNVAIRNVDPYEDKDYDYESNLPNYILDLPDNIYEFGRHLVIEYHKNGKYHREYGPALIRYYYSWYEHAKLSEINLPTTINYGSKMIKLSIPEHLSSVIKRGEIEYEEWYRYGKLHREGGAAIVQYTKRGEIKDEQYFVNGNRVWFKK